MSNAELTLNDYAFLMVGTPDMYAAPGTGDVVVNGHDGEGYRTTSRIVEYDKAGQRVRSQSGTWYKLGRPRGAWVTGSRLG